MAAFSYRRWTNSDPQLDRLQYLFRCIMLLRLQHFLEVVLGASADGIRLIPACGIVVG
jgi:hypothetical protein